LEESLKTSIVSAIITTGMAKTANTIGDAASGKIEGVKLDEFGRSFAHAVAGCVAGTAKAGSSDGCTAGAVGAVVGELAASFYNGDLSGNGGDGKGQPKADTVQFAALMSGVAGALVGGDAQSVNIAASTGANAAANNYLNHAELKDKLALEKQKTAACAGAGAGTAACAQASSDLDKLISLDVGRDKMLRESCTGASANEANCKDYKENAKAAANSINIANFRGVDANAAANERRETTQLVNSTPNAVDANTRRDINNVVIGTATVTVGVASGGIAPIGLRVFGAVAGATINGGAQVVLKPDEPFNLIDFFVSGATGYLTMGAGLTSTILTNTGGTILGTGLNGNGESATPGALGTAVGSAVGYGIGNKVIEPVFKKVTTPWYRPDEVVVGPFGITGVNTPAYGPVISGAAASGAAQEPVADLTKKLVEGSQ
jgi:hypothetical protein